MITEEYKLKKNKAFKQTVIQAACILACAASTSVYAANWLMLGGTEPPAAAARAMVFGFVQASYQKDYSVPNSTGGYVVPKMLGPDLDSQDRFNIDHANIAVRGTGFPIDDKVNYFVMLDMGHNGLTKDGSFAKLTDASVTLNYIHGARVRAGLFKAPTGEEAQQAIQVSSYIDYSQATNLFLNERLPNKGFTDCTGVIAPCNATTGNVGPYTTAQLNSGATLDRLKSPVSGYRDTGIQVFDAFKVGHDWELSYAAMVGNGSGVEFGNGDGNYDKYVYLSGEKIFSGEGPLREGVKLFAWNQTGTRLLDQTNDSVLNPKKFDRDRSGVGFKYLKNAFRFSGEYVWAKGMIFEGPDKPNFIFTSTANSNGATAKGNGWYAEGGWSIPGTKFELDARYDTATRNEGNKDQFSFNTWTLGTRYDLNKKTKVMVNYEIRDFKCDTSQTVCTNVNSNLSGVKNKVGVQVTASF